MHLKRCDLPGLAGRLYLQYTLHDGDGKEMVFPNPDYMTPLLIQAAQALPGTSIRFSDAPEGGYTVSLRILRADGERPQRIELSGPTDRA